MKGGASGKAGNLQKRKCMWEQEHIVPSFGTLVPAVYMKDGL